MKKPIGEKSEIKIVVAVVIIATILLIGYLMHQETDIPIPIDPPIIEPIAPIEPIGPIELPIITPVEPQEPVTLEPTPRA